MKKGFGKIGFSAYSSEKDLPVPKCQKEFFCFLSCDRSFPLDPRRPSLLLQGQADDGNRENFVNRLSLSTPRRTGGAQRQNCGRDASRWHGRCVKIVVALLDRIS